MTGLIVEECPCVYVCGLTLCTYKVAENVPAS